MGKTDDSLVDTFQAEVIRLRSAFASLELRTSLFNLLILVLVPFMMGLKDRQDTPGQPMDPIGLASVGLPHGISNMTNTGVPTADDIDREEEKSRLLREGPYLIADYLAQNSSKSAAVFRRYDKLAIYRLISLSKELREYEKRHDESVESGIDIEAYEGLFHSKDVGAKVLEYCTRLLHVRMRELTC